jgi:hypothetical protein
MSHVHRDEAASTGSVPALVLVGFGGVLAALFDVRATAVGWHLAAGREVLSGRGIPRADAFSFTAAGTPWLDHEWGFQTLAALADILAGTPGLIGLRALFVSALGLVIFLTTRRLGLAAAPGAALTMLALAGARMRFFVRPELATLLVTAVVLGLALIPHDRRPRWSAAAVGAAVAIGVNLHGGVLVVPLLLAVLAAGRLLGATISKQPISPVVLRELPLPTIAIAGTLANPWGWRLWEVPLHLADLVGRPWIPNPEWIAPGPMTLPHLWIALVAALLLLARFERDPGRWLLGLAAAALALRYVRNVGVFFVVIALVLTPTLVHLWRRIPASAVPRASRLALGLTVAILVTLPLDPRFPPRFGESETTYPRSAAAFLERHGLAPARVFNDVRFGGWLINRWYPDVQVFIDDRNEIHEPLLRELWEIWESSRPDRLAALLERWNLTTAVVHYRPAIRVHDPTGAELGVRGWSALWFPADSWALVHWDDAAMVLVRRTAHDPAWVDRHEYRYLRPDDIDFVWEQSARDPGRARAAWNELSRRLAEEPPSGRAQMLAERMAPLVNRPTRGSEAP